MVKYLILSSVFLILACGNQVEISNKKLQFNSGLADGTKVVDQNGMLKRGRPDMLTVNGSTYPVSLYSSHLALEFIASRTLTTQIEVKFKGRIRDSEMVLEIIELK